MDRDISTAGMLLRRAQRRNQLALDSALSQYGTNMAQWAVLKVMAEKPEATVTATLEQRMAALDAEAVDQLCALLERIA